MAGWGSGSFSYLDHFAYDDFGKVKDKYEKGVDVALVTDLLLLASRDAFDVAIICAGDADFFRAVEGVKEMGKEIYMRALIAIAQINSRIHLWGISHLQNMRIELHYRGYFRRRRERISAYKTFESAPPQVDNERLATAMRDEVIFHLFRGLLRTPARTATL